MNKKLNIDISLECTQTSDGQKSSVAVPYHKPWVLLVRGKGCVSQGCWEGNRLIDANTTWFRVLPSIDKHRFNIKSYHKIQYLFQYMRQDLIYIAVGVKKYIYYKCGGFKLTVKSEK